MSGTIEIYGYSDDLVTVEGHVSGCDEYTGVRADFIVFGEDGTRVRVGLEYLAEDGLWAMTIAPDAENIKAPPMTMEAWRYSARVTIDKVTRVVPTLGTT